jgi:RNase P subunit RPR2
METDTQPWGEKIEEVREKMRAWRRSNPNATLTEIEEAVEAELARLQQELVEELAGKAEIRESEEKEYLCPACQTPMQRNGKKKRRLRSKGKQVIELNREQLRCPACGMTLFPPG